MSWVCRHVASVFVFFFFFSSRRRHTRWPRDWSSDVCSSDLVAPAMLVAQQPSAMQGQTPAADTSKAAATKGKHGGKHKASKKGAKPAAKPAADTGKMKP